MVSVDGVGDSTQEHYSHTKINTKNTFLINIFVISMKIGNRTCEFYILFPITFFQKFLRLIYNTEMFKTTVNDTEQHTSEYAEHLFEFSFR